MESGGGAIGGVDIPMEDVERALRLKSFDYRVLNLVLHASLGKSRLERRAAERRRRRERGTLGYGGGGGNEEDGDDEEDEEDEEVNETHASFLATSELLVELSDDLYDYEEDVSSGAFNVYRCVVAARGAALAPAHMAVVIRAAEEEYQRALCQLEPELADKYRERCRQATRAGAVGGGGGGDGGDGGDGGGGGGGGGWDEEEAPEGRWQVPAPIADETAFRRRVNNDEEEEEEDEEDKEEDEEDEEDEEGVDAMDTMPS